MLVGILKALWARWKPIAHVIGEFQSRVVLSLFYFVVLGPFGVGVVLFGDPLRIRPGAGTGWLERPGTADIGAWARRQF